MSKKTLGCIIHHLNLPRIAFQSFVFPTVDRVHMLDYMNVLLDTNDYRNEESQHVIESSIINRILWYLISLAFDRDHRAICMLNTELTHSTHKHPAHSCKRKIANEYRYA